MLLYPQYRFRRIWEISPIWLQKKGITVLLLDVDNTLTTHDSPHVSKEVQAWLTDMGSHGIALAVLSNNSSSRVAPFAQQLHLEFFAQAKKPLGGVARTAMERLGAGVGHTALIGDQLFTDVLCAHMAGVIPILVEPMEPEPFFFFRVKRFFERKILNKCTITFETNEIEKR